MIDLRETHPPRVPGGRVLAPGHHPPGGAGAGGGRACGADHTRGGAGARGSRARGGRPPVIAPADGLFSSGACAATDPRARAGRG
jgi:hypothetical protein